MWRWWRGGGSDVGAAVRTAGRLKNQRPVGSAVKTVAPGVAAAGGRIASIFAASGLQRRHDVGVGVQRQADTLVALLRQPTPIRSMTRTAAAPAGRAGPAFGTATSPNDWSLKYSRRWGIVASNRRRLPHRPAPSPTPPTPWWLFALPGSSAGLRHLGSADRTWFVASEAQYRTNATLTLNVTVGFGL